LLADCERDLARAADELAAVEPPSVPILETPGAPAAAKKQKRVSCWLDKSDNNGYVAALVRTQTDRQTCTHMNSHAASDTQSRALVSSISTQSHTHARIAQQTHACTHTHTHTLMQKDTTSLAQTHKCSHTRSRKGLHACIRTCMCACPRTCAGTRTRTLSHVSCRCPDGV
jgi:hypothetical protein